MILKEEDVTKGQIMWKVGEKGTFSLVIKKGNF